MPARVLIIDDDPAQRRILEEMIKRMGLSVLSSDSGAKGLELMSGREAAGTELYSRHEEARAARSSLAA